ncbi:hypothetical protein M407DRAFT_244718 [Tulasnella calospora MUT 4182]|uniref:Uncharacterized protein n=1 Tax=Tulasnella calospora MUT 4182 TaxID=1051891 RepID=A0A0C3QDF1_9AGAM|nr:hypothetical protein M407DRAFT_244718 [Tulasnella calospora MUT 4182]
MKKGDIDDVVLVNSSTGTPKVQSLSRTSSTARKPLRESTPTRPSLRELLSGVPASRAPMTFSSLTSALHSRYR